MNTIINLLENVGIAYWIDGGWGVDLLAGKQTREQRDIDIDFDAQHTEKLLRLLLDYEYEADTDWRPVRIEKAAWQPEKFEFVAESVYFIYM